MGLSSIRTHSHRLEKRESVRNEESLISCQTIPLQGMEEEATSDHCSAYNFCYALKNVRVTQFRLLVQDWESDPALGDVNWEDMGADYGSRIEVDL